MRAKKPLVGTELVNFIIGVLKMLGFNPNLQADGVFGINAAKAIFELLAADLEPYEVNLVIGLLMANDLAVPGTAADGNKGTFLTLSLIEIIIKFGNDEAKGLLTEFKETLAKLRSQAAAIEIASSEMAATVGDLTRQVQQKIMAG